MAAKVACSADDRARILVATTLEEIAEVAIREMMVVILVETMVVSIRTGELILVQFFPCVCLVRSSIYSTI